MNGETYLHKKLVWRTKEKLGEVLISSRSFEKFTDVSRSRVSGRVSGVSGRG